MSKSNGKKGKDVKDILRDIKAQEVPAHKQYPILLRILRLAWFKSLIRRMFGK